MFITSMCKSLGVLPAAGGLLDQDPYWVEGMAMVFEAQYEAEEKQAKGKK